MISELAMKERIYRKLSIADLPLVMEMENDFRNDFIHTKSVRLFLSNPMNWIMVMN